MKFRPFPNASSASPVAPIASASSVARRTPRRADFRAVPRRRRSVAVAASVGVSLLALGVGGTAKPARAQTNYNWTGSANDGGIWSNGGNWAGGYAPTLNVGTIANFNGGSSRTTVLLDGDYYVKLLVFGIGSGAQSFTITQYRGNDGNQVNDLNIEDGGAVFNNTSLLQTINTGLFLHGNTTFSSQVAGGSLLFAFSLSANNGYAPISVPANLTLTGPGTITIARPIVSTENGSGIITNNGAATTVLGDNSGYSGVWTNNGGLTVGDSTHNSNLGTKAVTNNGNLFFRGGSSLLTGNNAQPGTYSFVNSSGASANFNDSSTAGGAVIQNNKNASINFKNGSTAENAQLYNLTGGTISFTDTASASQSIISNDGIINFNGNSSAEGAQFRNGQQIVFSDNASAAHCAIINDTGGVIAFQGASTADGASITNNGFLVIFDSYLTVSGKLTGSGNIDLVNGATLTLGNSYNGPLDYDDVVGGFIDGAGGNIVKVGTNVLTLNGEDPNSGDTSNYSGATVISGGTLAAGTATALGNSALVMNGGTLDLSAVTGGFSIKEASGSGTIAMGGNALTLGSANTSDILAATLADGGINDGGINGGEGASLVKVGTGTLTLTGNNTYTGTTTVSGGQLLVGSVNALGSQGITGVTLNGGQFGFANDPNSATGVTNTIARGFTLTGNGSGFVTQNHLDNLIATGTLSGSGSLTLVGSGTVTLTGANTYSGGTAVNGGTLAAGNVSALGTGALTLNNGTLDLSGATGGLSVSEASGTGSIALGGNALTIGSANTSDTLAAALSDGGIHGGTGGSLLKVGTGTLTLTAANTYTGTTTISAGTLDAESSGALGTSALVLNGGTLDISGTPGGVNLTEASGTGTIALGGNALTVGYANTSDTLAATITDGGIHGGTGGGLVKTGTGTLTLTGNNVYSFTTVTAGTLAVGNVNALGNSALLMNGGTLDLSGVTGGFTLAEASGSGTIALGGNTLTIGAPDTLDTLDATLTDGGIHGGTGASLIKSGTGTLTLTGNNTYTGVTTVSGGQLLVSAVSALGSQGIMGLNLNGGLFGFASDPDSPTGVVNTIARDFTLTGDGSGFVSENDLDKLTVAGNLTGSGSLTVFGGGTVTLLGSGNTYSGGTVVNGNLNVGDSASNTTGTLGSGSITVANNSGLNFYAHSTPGSAGITNSGTVSFSNNASAGSASINGGGYSANVKLYDNASLSSATLNGSNVTLNGNATAGSANISTSAITFNDAATAANASIYNSGFSYFNGNSTASHAAITNGDYLTFRDSATAGNAAITNNGSYGSLVFNDATSAGSSTITNSASIYFNDAATAGSANITNTYVDTVFTYGPYTFHQIVEGSVSFGSDSSAGTAHFANDGIIGINGANTAASAVINNTLHGVVSVGSPTGSVTIGELSGAGSVVLSGNALTLGGLNTNDTISGVISDKNAYGGGDTGGSLVKIGTGTLTLTGNNTFSGGTTIDGGTVAVGGANALGTGAVTLAGGSLSYLGQINGGTANVGALSGTGSVDDGGNTLAVGGSNTDATFGGGIRGMGGLIKLGTAVQTLTGTSVYTGGTSIDMGTLAASGSALGTGTVTAEGGTLAIGEAANATTTRQSVSALTIRSLAINSGTNMSGMTGMAQSRLQTAYGAPHLASLTSPLSLTNDATTGSAQPALSFNLGDSGTSDVLTITDAGRNPLTDAGSIDVGFSSATGNALGSGDYTLIVFSGQPTTANLPSLADFLAEATGNLSDINDPTFSYQTQNGVETLALHIGSAEIGGAAAPEPSVLLLLVPSAFGMLAACRASRTGNKRGESIR